ncbi:MAG: pentapeptide repeat-containing protein [Bacilli bacterium]
MIILYTYLSGISFGYKFNLLYKSIPKSIIPAKNYIFTESKKRFKIDDLLSNLDPDIPVTILFPSYHNKNVTDEQLYTIGAKRAGYDWNTGWEKVININITKRAKNEIEISPNIVIVNNREEKLNFSFIMKGNFMKFIKPKISNTIANNFIDSLNENSFSNYIFTKNCETNIEINSITFDSCIFENIDFNNIKLEDVSLIDVVFKKCDLSNQNFDNKLICRVKFENCKLVGTSFIGSNLKDVEFVNCNAKYLNLIGSKIRNLKIKDSNFTESSFSETNIKDVEFNNVEFFEAEFTNTNLNKIDFSNCVIKGIIFDEYSLKGIIINSLQASSIVCMLGVEIKD